MAAELVASEATTILVRDDHPIFLDMVESVVKWALTLSPEDENRPSAWFLGLLEKWVDEDRRVPVMELKRPSEVSYKDNLLSVI